MERPKLVSLCGPTYGGKTTFGKDYATRKGFPYLSPDDIVRERGLTNGVPWQLAGVVEEEYLGRLEQHLAAGRSVVDDRVHFRRARRDETRRFALQHNAQPVFVYVYAPDDEVWRRWRQDQGSQTRLVLPEQRVRQALARFEPPGHDEPHVVFRSGIDTVPEWVRRNATLLDIPERKSLIEV